MNLIGVLLQVSGSTNVSNQIDSSSFILSILVAAGTIALAVLAGIYAWQTKRTVDADQTYC
ncbi:MAG: hypothetical protein QXU32_12870 [Nitrososphaerales archaeon]